MLVVGISLILTPSFELISSSRSKLESKRKASEWGDSILCDLSHSDFNLASNIDQ